MKAKALSSRAARRPSLDDFRKFILQAKINLASFSQEQVETCFAQLSERRAKIEKSLLIRVLKNERDAAPNTGAN